MSRETVKKIPKVSFKYPSASKRNGHEKIQRILSNCIHDNGYIVDITKNIFGQSLIQVEVESKLYSIMIKQCNFNHGTFWVVSIIPNFSLLFLLKNSTPVPDKFVPNLMAICDHIQNVLHRTPNVQDIRWYFQWRNSYQSDAFDAPDELPW